MVCGDEGSGGDTELSSCGPATLFRQWTNTKLAYYSANHLVIDKNNFLAQCFLVTGSWLVAACHSLTSIRMGVGLWGTSNARIARISADCMGICHCQ